MAGSDNVRIASAFASSSDSEDGAAPKPAPVASTAMDQYAETLQREALEEDPSIFDYDGLVEEEQRASSRTGLVHARGTKAPVPEAPESKPKYMANLLAQAETRKIEQELVRLRNAKRKAGTAGGGDEEVFVTEAYREKLSELDEMEKKLKAMHEGREDDEDVRKKKDMSGFYMNLMKRNVAFGGKVRTGAKPAESNKAEQPESRVAAPSLPSTDSDSEETVEPVSFGPRRPVDSHLK